MPSTPWTPGPWRIVRREGTIAEDVLAIVGANGDTVADNEDYYPHALDERNARLIALAPELAGALEEMLADAETMQEPYRNEAICERVRALLARLHGEGRGD